jgi:hypothetical protein
MEERGSDGNRAEIYVYSSRNSGIHVRVGSIALLAGAFALLIGNSSGQPARSRLKPDDWETPPRTFLAGCIWHTEQPHVGTVVLTSRVEADGGLRSCEPQAGADPVPVASSMCGISLSHTKRRWAGKIVEVPIFAHPKRPVI